MATSTKSQVSTRSSGPFTQGFTPFQIDHIMSVVALLAGDEPAPAGHHVACPQLSQLPLDAAQKLSSSATPVSLHESQNRAGSSLADAKQQIPPCMSLSVDGTAIASDTARSAAGLARLAWLVAAPAVRWPPTARLAVANQHSAGTMGAMSTSR